MVEGDEEYRVGEDGEVENGGGGHGEQYGQEHVQVRRYVRVSNKGIWMRLRWETQLACCGTQRQ